MAMVKCSECEKEVSNKAAQCMNCGCPIQNLPVETMASDRKLVCPKCNSNSIKMQAVQEQAGRDTGVSIIWVVMAFLTCGLWLLFIPLLTKSPKVTKIYAICNNCGNSWNPNENRIYAPEPFNLSPERREEIRKKGKRNTRIAIIIALVFGLLYILYVVYMIGLIP